MIKRFAAVLLAAMLAIGAAGCSGSRDEQTPIPTSATSAADTVDFVEVVTDKDLKDKNVDYLVQHGYTKNTDSDILSYCKQGGYLGYTLNYRYVINDDNQRVSFLAISPEYDDYDTDYVKAQYVKLMDELNKIGSFYKGKSRKSADLLDKTEFDTPYDVLQLLDDTTIDQADAAWQIDGNYITVSVSVNLPSISMTVSQGYALMM